MIQTPNLVKKLEINIDDIVKLNDGREVKIINLPSSFLANGSYEVSDPRGRRSWVNPEDVMYVINEEYQDSLDDYLEVIMDENGVNIIPKDVNSIEVETVGGFNYIKLNLGKGRKHSLINLYLGDTEIVGEEEEKEQEKKGLLKKLLDITKKEDE